MRRGCAWRIPTPPDRLGAGGTPVPPPAPPTPPAGVTGQCPCFRTPGMPGKPGVYPPRRRSRVTCKRPVTPPSSSHNVGGGDGTSMISPGGRTISHEEPSTRSSASKASSRLPISPPNLADCVSQIEKAKSSPCSRVGNRETPGAILRSSSSPPWRGTSTRSPLCAGTALPGTYYYGVLELHLSDTKLESSLQKSYRNCCCFWF